MGVDAWINGFLVGHIRRHPRPDWPSEEASEDFFDSWRRVFILHGIQHPDVAEEASVRLVGEPPRFLADHLPGLLKFAKEVYRDRAAAGRPEECDSWDAARLASGDCRDCEGKTGLAVRYRKLSALEGRKNAVVFYCRCSAGRWLERHHRQSAAEVHRRIPDLEAHPFLWGDEYRESCEAGVQAALDRAAAAREARRRALAPNGGAAPAPNVVIGPDGAFVAVPPGGRLPTPEPAAAGDPF